MRGQVSFEFVVLFTFLLVVFALMVSFVTRGLEFVTTGEESAQVMADDFKLRLIAASLSPSDFTSSFTFPKTLNGDPIRVSVLGGSDNLLFISSENSTLARAFLPRVDTVVNPDPNSDAYVFEIEKTGNSIVVREVESPSP